MIFLSAASRSGKPHEFVFVSAEFSRLSLTTDLGMKVNMLFVSSEGTSMLSIEKTSLLMSDSEFCLVTVTHYSMWLLVSWAHCSSTVKSSLADSDHLHDWLRKLTLLVPEVSRLQQNSFERHVEAVL